MGRNKDCIWKVEKAKKNRENDCGKQEAQNKRHEKNTIEICRRADQMEDRKSGQEF